MSNLNLYGIPIFFILLLPALLRGQIPSFNQAPNQYNPSGGSPISPHGNTDAAIKQQTINVSMQRNAAVMPTPPPSDPLLRHQLIISEAYADKRTQQQQQLKTLLAEGNTGTTPPIGQNEVHYRQAFQNLFQAVAKDSFSLKEAVFLTENAWYGGKLDRADYTKKIKTQADWARLVMKREKLNPSNSLHINYAVQKLYQGKITRYDREGKPVQSHIPLRYDFKDYRGDTSWTNMFVGKLLTKGTGQCHSMPLLYLMVMEELGGEAYLSMAPEHSFIRFRDEADNWYSFEATNGNLVSEDWLMSTGYVNAAAVKNRIFMDTLGKKQLAAHVLVDMAMGYRQKFGYDNFLWEVVNRTLKIDGNNVQALMIKADMLAVLLRNELYRLGNPPASQIPSYPRAQEYHKNLMGLYKQIDDLGYATMPEEQYRMWLKSLNNEERKMEKQQLETKLKINAKLLD